MVLLVSQVKTSMAIDVTPELAQKMQRLRSDAGLTQEQLARDAGLGVERIRKLEIAALKTIGQEELDQIQAAIKRRGLTSRSRTSTRQKPVATEGRLRGGIQCHAEYEFSISEDTLSSWDKESRLQALRTYDKLVERGAVGSGGRTRDSTVKPTDTESGNVG